MGKEEMVFVMIMSALHIAVMVKQLCDIPAVLSHKKVFPWRKGLIFYHQLDLGSGTP